MSFVNKVVIVVGASSGIGAATAISFAKEGAHVAIIGRNEEKLKNVSEQCGKFGKKPLIIKADISKDEEAKIIVSKTIEKFGNLDILINNAGIIKTGSVLSGTIMATYDEVMNTNLRSIVHLTTLSAPYLVKSKGNVINISSVAGTSGTVLNTQTYAISKAGLNHFTRVAARELASVDVRVNTISPGPVKTDILKNANLDSAAIMKDVKLKTALNRISEPEEIADLILFLASDKAKGITGSEFVSDNGILICCK